MSETVAAGGVTKPAPPSASNAPQPDNTRTAKSSPRHLFERLWYAVTLMQRLWASSLRLRVITVLIVGVVIGASIIGVAITSQIRTAMFDQAVYSNVEEFSAEAIGAQDRFSAGIANTSGQTQQVANELVAKMYDPARGLMGAALMRTPGQDTVSTQIVEPTTASGAAMRSLVSNDLRKEVQRKGKVAWQSVGIPADQQDSASALIPGIVIGTAIYVPSSGSYELYALYSLGAQEKLLDSTYRVLSFGIVALIVVITLLIVLMLRSVLRPVREAAEGAQQLAKGALDTRMKVTGSDELAQLATSFNKMASSLADQFEWMERMSSVQTEFVSAVSHELRSPVTTIRMAGQLIYDKREELPPTLKRSAELQHDQLINLDSLLSDLLEISRYDAGAMNLAAEQADLAQIARQVMEMAQPLATDNGVQMQFAAQGETNAEVEPRRIERVIRNLVVNALEHAESKPIMVRVVGNNTAVGVAVIDHGVGLTPEQAEHVFDRFWRADSSRVRKTGGTGLGLTIAREDALIHGGTLTAAGELGVGSMFVLVVPKVPGAAFMPPIKAVTPPAETPESAPIPPDAALAVMQPEAAAAVPDAAESAPAAGSASAAVTPASPVAAAASAAFDSSARSRTPSAAKAGEQL